MVVSNPRGSFEGNRLAVHLLLEAGIDPNITDADGYTPLMHLIGNSQAPASGIRTCLAFLTDAGAESHCELADGRGLLHLAASSDGHYLI